MKENISFVSLDEQFLHSVSTKSFEDIKHLLANNNFELNPKTCRDALTLACSIGSYNLVKILIDHTSDNYESNENEVSLILTLCSSKSKKEDELLLCLDLLLSRGADKDYCDSNGTCVMSHAVKYNHEKIILKLINHGANINKSDIDGWSPIFYAVGYNNIYLVSLLKDYGANIYLLDRYGRSLVDVSLEVGNKKMIMLLNGSLDLSSWYKHLPSFIEDKKCSSIYDTILSKLPKKDDRLSGYIEEGYNIMKSINLPHLVKELYDRDIGLGHLLTSNDDELKQLGVIFWYERQKILSAVQHFHEHPWSTRSLETSTCYKELDLKITQLITTIGRQMYLISISTYWWAENGGIDSQLPKLQETLKDSLKTVQTLKRTIKTLSNLFVKIGENRNTMPSDLITYKTKSNIKNNIGSILVPCIVLIAIYSTRLHSKVYSVILNVFFK